MAQICERAGVNIASVNYHFGSKEDLLREVLKRTFAIANEQYPITGDFVEKMSAEERIRNHMEAMIRRCFDSGPSGHAYFYNYRQKLSELYEVSGLR